MQLTQHSFSYTSSSMDQCFRSPRGHLSDPQSAGSFFLFFHSRPSFRPLEAIFQTPRALAPFFILSHFQTMSSVPDHRPSGQHNLTHRPQVSGSMIVRQTAHPPLRQLGADNRFAFVRYFFRPSVVEKGKTGLIGFWLHSPVR